MHVLLVLINVCCISLRKVVYVTTIREVYHVKYMEGIIFRFVISMKKEHLEKEKHKVFIYLSSIGS